MTWHADAEVLRGYTRDVLTPAHAASVEAHLMTCADCRAELGNTSDVQRLVRNRALLIDRLDERTGLAAERLLTRLGISEHRARMVAITPAAHAPWVLGLAAVIGMVSLVTAFEGGGSRDATFYMFLVLAPLLPVAGIAAAFGSGGDPARDLTNSLPTPAFELLLVRSLAVIAVTTGLTAVAAIPFPGGWEAAAWLLPALGLTASALALSTWVRPHRSAVAVGALWLLAAFTSWQANRVDPDVVARFFALQPDGQAVFAALGVAGAAAFYIRRHELDLRRFA